MNKLFSICVLLWAGLSSAEVQVTIPTPDWKVRFNPLYHDSQAPRLQGEEFPLVNAVRPLLDKEQYADAMKQLQKDWPADASAALFYIRGQIATQLEDYSTAEKDYLEAVKKHGEFLMAMQSLAGLSLIQEKHQKAHQYLTKAIALGGQSADLFGQLGYLNLRYHSAFSSVAAYQRAFALQPENKNWQQGLLMALTRSGSHHQADKLIDELLKKQPENRDLWLHKANAAIAAKDKSKALYAMEVAIRLGERHWDNVQLASHLNLEAGNIRRAVDLLENNSKLMADYQFVKPVLSWLSDNQRWAQLERLLASSSKNASKYRGSERSHLNLQKARLSLQHKRTKAAQNQLRKALEFDPANGEALLILAQQHVDSQRLDQADLLLSRAAALSEHREEALLKRAQIAYQQQLYREAYDLINSVFQENPERRDLIENMDILQRLIRQNSQT